MPPMPLLWLTAAMLIAGGCSRSHEIERLEWTTMGTVAAAQFRGAAADFQDYVGKCQYVCKLITSRFNAHDPSSRIRQLSSRSETQILAESDAMSRPCYEAAFRLMRESGGAFNPRWRGKNTLDLGAIAKGYAIDVFYEEYRELRPEDSLMDVGGNLRSIRGSWRVGIEGSDEVVVLTNGMACATSAEYFRGKHIYDGRTGLAVSNEVVSVTVVHPTSAMLADGLSTTLFVLGKDEGEKFLTRYYPEAKAYWILKE